MCLLDPLGFNRHITAADEALFDVNYVDSFLFQKGDRFGSDDQIEGCYKNYKFNSGDKLGLTFEVTSLSSSKAIINVKEAE